MDVAGESPTVEKEQDLFLAIESLPDQVDQSPGEQTGTVSGTLFSSAIDELDGRHVPIADPVFKSQFFIPTLTGILQ